MYVCVCEGFREKTFKDLKARPSLSNPDSETFRAFSSEVLGRSSGCNVTVKTVTPSSLLRRGMHTLLVYCMYTVSMQPH